LLVHGRPLALQASVELALANLFHKSNPKLNKRILRVIHRKIMGRDKAWPGSELGLLAHPKN
jgi:hypothetical protein